MNRSPAPANGFHDRPSNSGLAMAFVLLLGFLVRLGQAAGTFLNFDEAMHVLAAHKPSLAEAYRASLDLAHPPLLILLLQVWQKLGTSEWMLRLPSAVAGTIFCWIFFLWLARLFGPVAAWTGLVLASFLPSLIELSSEVRQYPLLLCFMILAAYLLELAVAEQSAVRMLLSFAFLYLALLTHFSAILFAASAGIYSLWRLVSARLRRPVLGVWIAGQAGALGLFAGLYQTQIRGLKDSAAARHMHVLLANSYFHPGHDHLLPFAFARTFSVLQYSFGQLVVGDVAGLLLVASVVLLLRPGGSGNQTGPSRRQLGVFLALGFAINCATAVAGLYPYGGTRHSAILVPFAVAGVSLAMAKLARHRVDRAVGAALLTVALCHLFGLPRRPYMRREDQSRAHMTQALDALRQRVPPSALIFVDFQTNFLLRFYLCPDADPGVASGSGFREYGCGGYRVISTSSETAVLTAGGFAECWSDLLDTYHLAPGQPVWIFQAGWDIALGRELAEKNPKFHALNAQNFGRNISLFRLSAPQANAVGGQAGTRFRHGGTSSAIEVRKVKAGMQCPIQEACGKPG